MKQGVSASVAEEATGAEDVDGGGGGGGEFDEPDTKVRSAHARELEAELEAARREAVRQT